MSLEQYIGCVLGLALGDSFGAPYEGGVAERVLWTIIGHTRHGLRRWTDDTQLALDTAESLIKNRGVNQDDLALTYAKHYAWSRGYGLGTTSVLRLVRKGIHWSEASKAIYKDGSYGNGAAIRAPMVALFFFGDRATLLSAVKLVSEVTHPNKNAIEGAMAIAVSVDMALKKCTTVEILNELTCLLDRGEFCRRLKIMHLIISGDDKKGKSSDVRRFLGNSSSAIDSCCAAICLALLNYHKSFEFLMEGIIECGGDVDSIGAMAGSIWGARNGCRDVIRLPLEMQSKLIEVATDLFHSSAISKKDIQAQVPSTSESGQ